MTTTGTQVEISTPSGEVEAKNSVAPFSIWRILRLSTFQIGSAMGDILTAGVWNRLMIHEFGIPAWPVGLLLALKYLIAPISLWVGHRSDSKPLGGWYRTPYIWLGRSLIVLSFPLLGASTVRLEQNSSDPSGWLLAVGCFLLYGIGTLSSGSPYLALVRDSAPKEKQGLAIGIVEMVLIAMFPIAAVGFGRMLETYEPGLFWRLLLFVAAVGGFFWFFAIVGVEKANRKAGVSPEPSRQVALRATLKKIWADPRTRRFFVFLSVATFSAWIQDSILEPYAADIYGMGVSETTRLTAYWGTATVLVLGASFIIWRKRRPEEQKGVTRLGLFIMALGMILVLFSTIAVQSSIFLLSLVVFGSGFGLYSFGGFSLMAVMSPEPNSGAYLGLWTVAVLVSKGLGTLMGGVVRDVSLTLGSTSAQAYGAAFALAARGLLTAVWIIGGLDVLGFARDTGRMKHDTAVVSGIDL